MASNPAGTVGVREPRDYEFGLGVLGAHSMGLSKGSVTQGRPARDAPHISRLPRASRPVKPLPGPRLSRDLGLERFHVWLGKSDFRANYQAAVCTRLTAPDAGVASSLETPRGLCFTWQGADAKRLAGVQTH